MQKSVSLKQILLVLTVAILLSLNYAVAEAQQSAGAGIKLIPATIESASEPGDVLRKMITIENVSEEDKQFYLYKQNIKGVENGGVPVFARDGEEVTGFEIADWLSFEKESVMVPARGKIELPLTITIPEDATPGSHFGGIFVSVQPPKLRQNGAGVGYEVASIVSIRISGDIIDSVRVRSLSTDKLFYSTKNVSFQAKIENQGNILVRPYGQITITSMFGGKAINIPVNESLAGVFPGTVRDLNFTWSDVGPGFGRYEAVLGMSYDGDGGQKSIDASVIFWIFPTKIMLIILGVFVGIFGIGYGLTKYYIRQAVMRAAGGRRITTQRYRKQVGISRFTFVMVTMMFVIVVFLISLLIIFA